MNIMKTATVFITSQQQPHLLHPPPCTSAEGLSVLKVGPSLDSPVVTGIFPICCCMHKPNIFRCCFLLDDPL